MPENGQSRKAAWISMPNSMNLIADDATYRALISRVSRFDGVFFVSFTSTGSHCRPICPVKVPKRENCRFYQSSGACAGGSCSPSGGSGHAAHGRGAGESGRGVEFTHLLTPILPGQMGRLRHMFNIAAQLLQDAMPKKSVLQNPGLRVPGAFDGGFACGQQNLASGFR